MGARRLLKKGHENERQTVIRPGSNDHNQNSRNCAGNPRFVPAGSNSLDLVFKAQVKEKLYLWQTEQKPTMRLIVTGKSVI